MEELFSRKQRIEWEAGWSCIKQLLMKLERILEGSSENITSDELMKHYTLVFNMCSQKPPFDHSQQLYEGSKGFIVEYLNSKVISSLSNKTKELFLKELVRRWGNHKVMVKWLDAIFGYLDRYYVQRRGIHTLHKVVLHSFRDLVYEKFKCKAIEALVNMMNGESEGKPVDKALLKGVADFCAELGVDSFEKALCLRMQLLSIHEKHQSKL